MRSILVAAGAVAILLVGAGAGAGLYAALGPSSESTTTVVQQDSTAQPVAASSGLSINSIYKRTYQGVVDIKVTQTNDRFGFGGGSSQAEGSGFVYDSKGDIVTNQHVVSGANTITVSFSNGKEYKAKLV